MPTLKTELARPMPPKPKVVHLALVDLGPGEHTPAAIAEALGFPPKGKYLTQVISGAKWLRARGFIKAASSRAIVAGAAYAKPVRTPVKKTTRKKAVTNA